MSDLHRPEKIHRTLVWGGWYGSRNIGDTAILLGIKELYEQINYDRHYYLGYLSTDPDYTNTNGVTGKRALLKNDVLKPWNWVKLVNTFREADRVIISGGTPIFDFSHKIRTAYFFLPLVFHKPFILFGAGVKPIKSRYGRWYIPYVIKKANYISTRDEGSTQILKNLGIPQVRQTADSAFFAPAATNDELNKVLQRYSIKPSDRILVIAPRLMSPDQKRLYLDEHMDSDTILETPKKIALTVDSVASSFDKVIFMAMHYYGPDSDVKLIEEIISLCQAKNVIFLEEELRPTIGIALFNRAEIVLAMRLHALLLSSSMYTPIVGIAYEQKVKDLFKRLDLPDYCVDMFTFTSKELTQVVKASIENQSKINTHLKKRVSKLRNLVIKDAEKVLKINETYSDK